MTSALRAWLSWRRLLPRPHLVGAVGKQHPPPEELPERRVLVGRDGHFEKGACFRCPGGGGETIRLSLSSRPPRWSVRLAGLHRPPIPPSIRPLNGCPCHCWVRQGLGEWCLDSDGRQGGGSIGKRRRLYTTKEDRRTS